MPNPRLSIRLDFANGDRIGPGKIALLEAIRSKGSITVVLAQNCGNIEKAAISPSRLHTLG
jgi:molybdenum-dependent DNA-binding transcriptional regulator ModE